ncbi:MAG: hypothetical protein CME69_06140 [Halobacteriovorax sp.]|nr:hypothetical protein [Halobacteriovorax sp.]|tara:strand:- start:306 stop:713 length:408 start_codon:yes stop_codon:yes gene_type:complete
MKKFIFLFFMVHSAYSFNLDWCKNERFPSVCVGESILRAITQFNITDDIRTGVYEYYKGSSRDLKGTRKIIVERYDNRYSIKYHGSDGELYATFKCEIGSSICYSNDKHILTILRSGDLFIDWEDDTNGFFKLIR